MKHSLYSESQYHKQASQTHTRRVSSTCLTLSVRIILIVSDILSPNDCIVVKQVAHVIAFEESSPLKMHNLKLPQKHCCLSHSSALIILTKIHRFHRHP